MPHDDLDDRNAGRARPMRGIVSQAFLGAALACVVVCANAAVARAGDDDGPSYYDQFMSSLGLKSPGAMEAGINYSERSPLVVPPTRDLPPPQASDARPVPNWPKDADIKRREQAKAEKKQVGPHPDWALESDRALRPDQLNPGGVKPGAGATASNTGPQNDQATPPPKKSIFSLDWFGKKEEYATFTGEPARTSLTDPPPGYLTPSPDEPYGLGPDRKKYKIDTPADHGMPTR